MLFCENTTWPSLTAASKCGAAEPGSAFVSRASKDLDLIFSLQFERTVNRDDTVSFQNLTLQIRCAGKQRWLAAL
jgi:hypothetical protein